MSHRSVSRTPAAAPRPRVSIAAGWALKILAGVTLVLVVLAGGAPAGTVPPGASDAAKTGAAAAAPKADDNAAPKVGDKAPDFTLPYATADTVMYQGQPLSDALKSGPVLLAFYPADWSPGCTKEVCTLRDSFTGLSGLGVTVWGISGDNPWSHRAWIQYHKLPFRLLSDNRHDVAQAYGSFNPENGYNRRTVFLVGTDGRIRYENTHYSVADSTDFHLLRGAVAQLK